MTLRPVAAALAALTLAACAATPPVPHPRTLSPPPEPAAPPAQAAPAPAAALPIAALPGWAQDDHAAAFAAFRAACAAARVPDLGAACRSAQTLGALDEAAARRFFEARFVAEREPAEGVLTGYFTPAYPARDAPDAEFSAALRAPPAGLTAGPPRPDRAAIEAAPPQAALAWLRPEDLFFLQIQGSGVLVFADGRRARALYAASNGRPFVAIAGPMRERGLLAADAVSADAIHAWLAAHRGPEAQALMRLNPRYVFFRLAPDDGRPPVGSAGLALPPGRAVAVDPLRHPMGELIWVDGHSPLLAGARPTWRRLVVALDTGGAIRGPARADLYLGEGEAAGAEAGRVRHVLDLYRLKPRKAAP